MKKYFATFKYLFFPFLMANCTGTDFTKLYDKNEVTINVETASFQHLETTLGSWMMSAPIEKKGQPAHQSFFIRATEGAGKSTNNGANNSIPVNCEFLMPEKFCNELINQ